MLSKCANTKKSLTKISFLQFFLGDVLERVLLVEGMGSAFSTRHQKDVVPLPHGDPIGLLERGELQQVIM